MTRRLKVCGLTPALAFSSIQVAAAADLPAAVPVYKAPAVAVGPSDFYLWVDGAYDAVRLPTYALGYQNLTVALMDLGPAQSFRSSLDGGGVCGAVGYVLPGSDTRIEFGGSYVAASGTAAPFASPAPSEVGMQFLNGSLVVNGATCSGGTFTCAVAGTLTTSYSAWQVNGKVATDWKLGAVTVTPSAAIFGASSHANQTLSQSFTQFDLGVTDESGTYAANTSLRWTDIGARAGLDVTAPLAGALTVGFGGWIGLAERHSSLSGSDTEVDKFNFFPGASTISTTANKGVFLANAEAGIACNVTSVLSLRGFAGLNYDASVPGIASPAFSGNVLAVTATTPAHIDYTHETSYYTGGGVSYRF
jgi:hypothetical protein